MTARTPCATNTALFDTALFDDDVPTTDRAQAIHRAATLCARCPSRGACPQPVTHDTTPQPLTLLAPDWLPPAREGRPDPTHTGPGDEQRREWGRRSAATRAVPRPGRDYVPPGRRVARWTAMAAELAAAGMPLAGIAERLCVTEDTVRRLLAETRKAVAA